MCMMGLGGVASVVLGLLFFFFLVHGLALVGGLGYLVVRRLGAYQRDGVGSGARLSAGRRG